jgi:hypothetical protein
MNGASKILLLAGLLIVTSAAVCEEKPDLVWCYGCTDQQMESEALRQTSGAGVVYVGDTVSDKIKAFLVSYGLDKSTSPPLKKRYAESIVPDPNIAEVIHKSVAFYNALPVGWHKHICEEYPSGKRIDCDK